MRQSTRWINRRLFPPAALLPLLERLVVTDQCVAQHAHRPVLPVAIRRQSGLRHRQQQVQRHPALLHE